MNHRFQWCLCLMRRSSDAVIIEIFQAAVGCWAGEALEFRDLHDGRAAGFLLHAQHGGPFPALAKQACKQVSTQKLILMVVCRIAKSSRLPCSYYCVP